MTSETNSRTIGTYNEIIVVVPCSSRRASGWADSDIAFVLATYTDSSASILGEWLVGWGSRKSQAFGTRTKDGALEVRVRFAPMRLSSSCALNGHNGAVGGRAVAVDARC